MKVRGIRHALHPYISTHSILSGPLDGCPMLGIDKVPFV